VGPPGTPPPDAMWGQRRPGPVCHWATRCRRVDAVGGQGETFNYGLAFTPRERDWWVGLAGTGCELIVSCGDENPGDHCDSLIL
jgi:hypothetical protein